MTGPDEQVARKAAEQVVELLRQMGCPPEKCHEMAVQLDKRARQIAVQSGSTTAAAFEHLLRLMASGRAAQEERVTHPSDGP